MFLEQKGSDVEVGCWDTDNKWPPDHAFCDENSPAEEDIADED